MTVSSPHDEQPDSNLPPSLGDANKSEHRGIGYWLVRLVYFIQRLEHRWKWRLHDQWPIILVVVMSVAALVTILNNPPGFLRQKLTRDASSLSSEDQAQADNKISSELSKLMPGVVNKLGPIPPPGGVRERKSITVTDGDTLDKIFQDVGIEANDRPSLLKLLMPAYGPRDVQPGHQLEFAFMETGKLFSLRISQKGTEDIWLRRPRLEAPLQLEKVRLPSFQRTKASKGVIQDSLYVDAIKQGLSPNLVSELIRIFSYDVDFQRDIWEGDSFSVLYDQIENGRGVAQDQVVLAASITLRGKEIRYYRYDVKDPKARVGGEFYAPDGKTAKKSLLRTPIDGARLSSKFGMRKHPVLGYTKMHKGVDFAAPVGTPIYAAGDGVIDYADRYSTYGNYVRIRHNGTLSTAYAHMKGFAKNIRQGARVKQYQVIGWVGMTGRTTGPHLHFELLRDGRQVNPLTITAQVGDSLSGKLLADFQKRQQELDDLWTKALANKTSDQPASTAQPQPSPQPPPQPLAQDSSKG